MGIRKEDQWSLEDSLTRWILAQGRPGADQILSLCIVISSRLDRGHLEGKQDRFSQLKSMLNTSRYSPLHCEIVN
jgi:hypothetical protein